MATRNRALNRKGLELTHPNAAGIDIGSASHYVAVPADRDDEPVREFASFTADLHRLAEWLRDCGVDTVAMESTGVYWIPLFELLDARGFTVLLVNARHVKNVSGRKSDVLDCQWLQQLMTYGLLRGAFRPSDQVCVLRALARQRATLLRTQARSVQHMQKALVQMNIQLANVIADVAGASGQAILRAIVAGERHPYALARLKNSRVHASNEEIARSLQGTWRAEHLFALRQALDAFDFCGGQLQQCDQEIEAQLQRLHITEVEPDKGKKRSKARNAPKFDLRNPPVPNVRRGPHAYRRHRRDHRAGGRQRDRYRHEQVPQRQALRVLAGAVPGHQDHRRQGDERQDQALCEPGGAGAAAGGCGAARQSIGAGRVLPPHL